jgi:hypothetical protein
MLGEIAHDFAEAMELEEARLSGFVPFCVLFWMVHALSEPPLPPPPCACSDSYS